MADSRIIFKIVFTLFLTSALVIISVQSAPADLSLKIERNQSDSAIKNVSSTTETPSSTTVTITTTTKIKNQDEEEDEEEYDVITDQRQNGTENYRITLKDVVLIWAPSDALLSAAALLDPELFGGDFLVPGKPQDPQNQGPEIILEGLDKNNATNSASEPPEKESIHPTSKPAQLRRNLPHLSTLLGPFLKRKL